jgi:hypothetical protein
LDNSTFSKFSNNTGSSEANSGPFLILTENFSSKVFESHCTKPGSKIISKLKIDLDLRIVSVKDSLKNAEIEIGASNISIV